MQEKWVPLVLPSKCLVYKDVDPAKLQIRALKGKDEKLIAEISGDNFEKKFLALLRNVLQGIDPEKLTIGDRLFITIWEAMNSYSNLFNLKHECEHCWQTSEIEIDLTKFEVVELPDTFKQPYEIKLPNKGEIVKVNLLTIADVIKVDEMAKTGQNVWLYRQALALEMPGKSVFEKIEYLENLDASDLALIRVFHDKYFHGPKMESKYECPKCGGAGLVPVPFRIEMLFPYGQTLTRNFGNSI